MFGDRIFPWKAFLKFIVLQFFALALTLVLVGASLQVGIAVLGVYVVFSFWVGRRLDEESEWTDLETRIESMRSDLEAKTEELTREREELSTLMSSISDAILAVDVSGKPLFFNSTFILLFGNKDLPERRPALGEIFRAPEVLEAFRRALSLGQAQETSVSLHTSVDATPRYFMVSVSLLRKSLGDIYGAVGVFHDVTELKLAEQIRIEFVANVSHELRTPLTSIKGYTDTIREDAKSEKYDLLPKAVDVITRNVDRLMNLIGDLLDLSSLESGGQFEKVVISPRELTDRILGQLEPKRIAKQQQIDVTCGAETLHADPARLEQVVTNLLDNAIKYTPSQGKVELKWERIDRAVLLRVRDNGPGIPAEHQSRLFERFYRVDSARSREMGGTGLGLSIVKHIMQRHGGSVWVLSEPGKGAEFVCRFPD